MTVVETPFFLRKAASLMDDDARSELVTFMAANPEVGDIVPETGGVRKFRWGLKERARAAACESATTLTTKPFHFSS
jgi:hypothetical protein